MPRIIKLTTLFVGLLFLQHAPSAFAEASKSADEYTVKAGFVLNFLRFSRLRNDGEDVRLCVMAEESVFENFLQISGKTISGSKLNVSRFSPSDSIQDCKALFVSSNFQESFLRLQEQAFQNGVLTIGEGESFTQDGGIIALYREDTRVRFEVNITAVKKSGIEISSKLLGLARVVEYD